MVAAPAPQLRSSVAPCPLAAAMISDSESSSYDVLAKRRRQRSGGGGVLAVEPRHLELPLHAATASTRKAADEATASKRERKRPPKGLFPKPTERTRRELL